MATIFAARGNPNDLIRRGKERASTGARAKHLAPVPEKSIRPRLNQLNRGIKFILRLVSVSGNKR